MKPTATVRPPALTPAAAASSANPEHDAFRVRFARFLLFTAGVVATHFVLYAPSLLGLKVLLPLDDLAGANVYLPKTPEYADVVPRYPALSDQVLQFEFQRRFAAKELRSGRIPLWDPYNYCGAPFVVPFFSPYNVPYYIFPSYLTLAWIHVLVALVAAGGAYVFFRRVLGVGFWPAAVAAWCYPLSGFFQLWLGFYLSYTASFFPWLLVAVDSTVRRPAGWGGPGLALVTALLLISGAADLAGQALLAAGLFSLWQLGQQYQRQRDLRPLVRTAFALAGAWLAGILLAAPYLWPLLEYMPTGLRMQRRAGNVMERPPVGFSSLAQMIVPFIFGSTERGWVWASAAPNLQESSAQAYCGLFAMLVLAPVGLAVRRLRALNLFWVFLAVLTSAWVLNLWPITPLLQLPGVNLMSHNRFLFVFSFAILALAASGLDALARGEIEWCTPFRVPLLCVSVLFAWCIVSHFILRTNIIYPGEDSSIAAQQLLLGGFATIVVTGGVFLLLNSLRHDQQSAFVIPILLIAGVGVWCVVRSVELQTDIPGGIFRVNADSERERNALARVGCQTLQTYTIQAAVVCAAALMLWVVAFRAPRRLAAAILGIAVVAELVWFERGQNPQSDPSLYYPPIPELSTLANSPDRIAGLYCLPPMLPQAYGLRDVRGYDAVDPARIVRLLTEIRHPKTMPIDYAMTQWWLMPLIKDGDGNFKIVPALSMLNLRYIIGRGKPPDLPRFKPLLVQGDDYWIYENPKALPRAYVPASVRVLSEKKTFELLTDLNKTQSAMHFDPRAVGYVESDVGLKDQCRGTAEVTAETPCEVHVSVDMETAGLLVLADQWYPGWKASLNGQSVPVVPANYALRGVPLPAGRGEVIFRYESTGWARGLRAFAVAAIALAVWAAVIVWYARRTRAHATSS
jgi:hypothetical protein